MAKNGKLIWVLHHNSKNPQSNHYCHLWAKNYHLASDLQSFERKKSMVGGINFLKNIVDFHLLCHTLNCGRHPPVMQILGKMQIFGPSN